MNYWLMKTEPGDYSWSDLQKDKQIAWTGVRNYAARNNMRDMKKGDMAFIYHSVKERAIVGIAKIVKEAYDDHTAKKGDWQMVDLAPVKAVTKVINLDDVKANSQLKDMVLANNSRLSVQPVKASEWKEILTMTETKL